MQKREIIRILTVGLAIFYLISCNKNNPTGPNLPQEEEKEIILSISGKITDALTDLPLSETYVELRVCKTYFPDYFEEVGYEKTHTNKNGIYFLDFKLLSTAFYIYYVSAYKQNYSNGYYSFYGNSINGQKFSEDTNHTVDFKLDWLGPFEPGIPVWHEPAEGAILDNGRTDGRDFSTWTFRWSRVNGATKYNLIAIGPNTSTPLVNIVTNQTIYVFHLERSYIPNKDRLNWRCRVRAYVNDMWCEWSEWRHFNVEPVNTDPPIGG